MALIFREPWRRPYYSSEMDFPIRLFEQNFGRGIFDDDLLAPLSVLGRTVAPRLLHNREASGLSEVKADKNHFRVNLDVQQFRPEELNVKTVDNCLVIEGKHEEKQDEHGYVSRHFVRRYMLPEDAKAEQIQCNLSSDGVLQIQVARAPQAVEGNERPVPIMQSGQPAIPKNQAQSQIMEDGDATKK